MNSVRNAGTQSRVLVDSSQKSVSEISNGMKRSSQSGSHILAVAVGLFVVGVLAFSGYKVWQMQQPSPSSPSTQTAATAPTTIKSSADLSQAAKYLDEASTQLNSSFDANTFNADINSML